MSRSKGKGLEIWHRVRGRNDQKEYVLKNQKKLVITVFGIVLAAVVAAAVYHYTPDATSKAPVVPNVVDAPLPPRSITPDATAGRPSVPAKRAAAESALPKHVLSASRDRPDEVIKEVEDAAKRGEPEAMRMLAVALRTCSIADMGDDDAIKSRAVNEALGLEHLYEKVGQQPDTQSMAESLIENRIKIRDSCVKVSFERAKTWLDWMERAALAGDNEARKEYARTALAEFDSAEQRIANSAEYDRRRHMAFDLLEQSLDSGDCSSPVVSGMQQMGGNPTDAYIYGSILLQQGLSALAGANLSAADLERERAAIMQALSVLAAGVPADQLTAANIRMSEILRGACAR